MDVLIVGSIALDDVKTPFGEVHRALGGSAVFSSLAATYFAEIGLVGVAGRDFPDEYRRLLLERGICLDGMELAEGSTFHWSGYYEYDMGSAHTVDTQLNVFADFSPKIPHAFRNTPFVFLANIDPVLQMQVLEQLPEARFKLLDTMNYWIQNKREQLLQVMRRTDMVVVNDAEARQLAGTPNLIKAAAWIREQGIRGIAIKKGEHGALIFWEDRMWVVPALPLEGVKDPTGAGDTFAGGLIGTLAKFGEITPASLRTAASIGTVMASFAVEDFSVRGLIGLDEDRIRDRYGRLCELTRFDEYPGCRIKA